MKKEERERTEALVETGISEILTALGLPGAGLFGLAAKTLKARREKRIHEMLRVLLEGKEPMSDDAVRKTLEEDDLGGEVFLKVWEDEEDTKAWAYAAVFRAFAEGLVPERQLRLAFLRVTRELSNLDLRSFSTMRHGYFAIEPPGPYVLVRITFEGYYREWKLYPELLLEDAPNLVDALCRHGFIRRVHDRTAEKTKKPHMLAGFREGNIPVPGRFRLQIEPYLALYMFVVAARANGDGLQLRSPKELSATQVGSIENATFSGRISLRFDENGQASRTVLTEETKEGPVPGPPTA